jgi:hypothetical protein
MTTVAVPDTGRPPAARAAVRAGMIAGPLFAAASFAQVPFRDGFDLTEHAFSFLLLGPGGRVQTVVFVLAGALYAICGVGLRVALTGRSGRWAQRLVGGVGAGLIVGGLFPPDASYGYPAGAPAGRPERITAVGAVHGLAFVLAMISWCALLLVLARWMARHRQRGWAVVATITAVGLLAVPAATGQGFATVLLYVVVTAAYLVTSALFGHVQTLSARIERS